MSRLKSFFDRHNYKYDVFFSRKEIDNLEGEVKQSKQS